VPAIINDEMSDGGRSCAQTAGSAIKLASRAPAVMAIRRVRLLGVSQDLSNRCVARRASQLAEDLALGSSSNQGSPTSEILEDGPEGFDDVRVVSDMASPL
jgi:hypothetical protein